MYFNTITLVIFGFILCHTTKVFGNDFEKYTLLDDFDENDPKVKKYIAVLNKLAAKVDQYRPLLEKLLKNLSDDAESEEDNFDWLYDKNPYGNLVPVIALYGDIGKQITPIFMLAIQGTLMPYMYDISEFGRSAVKTLNSTPEERSDIKSILSDSDGKSLKMKFRGRSSSLKDKMASLRTLSKANDDKLMGRSASLASHPFSKSKFRKESSSSESLNARGRSDNTLNPLKDDKVSSKWLKKLLDTDKLD